MGGRKKALKSAKKAGTAGSSKAGAVDQMHDPAFYQVVLPSLRTHFTALGKEEYWWIMDESVEAITKTLEARNFVIIDGFLGAADASKMREEVRNKYEGGQLTPGNLAGGTTGRSTTYVMEHVRGDYIGWFDGGEQGLDVVGRYLKKVDTLISEMKDTNLSSTVTGIDSRSKAMLACYPGKGARYVRHCDNPNENGRVLTALYYANPEWKRGDGGELRVYSCAASDEGLVDCDGNSLQQWDKSSKGVPKPGWVPGTHTVGHLEGSAEDGSKPVVVEDVQPLADRLVLFFSDKRVPHEVLPSNASRHAVTTWFMSRKDAMAARQRFSTDEDTQKAEQEKIRKEMEDMQTKYGGTAKLSKQTGSTDSDTTRNDTEGSDRDGQTATSSGQSECNTAGEGWQSGESQKTASRRDGSVLGNVSSNGNGVKAHKIPAHEVKFIAAGHAGAREMDLTIELPDVQSMAEVELDVDSRSLSLEVVGTYVFNLELEHAIDVDSVKARFKRKVQTLSVSAACL